TLQSSLNAENGMGISLPCALTDFLNNINYYVIRKHLYEIIFVCRPSLMTTSAILGMGGSPLWSAKCTYLTISGNRQSQKINKKGQDLINQYFAVWGNLMSSLIFGQDTSIEVPEENLQFCGATSCVENFTVANSTLPARHLWFLVPAGVGVLAIIFVAVFLDNIDRDLAREFRKTKGNQSFCSTFLTTFKLLRDPRLLLLIPLTMYSGFEQSFLAGEYTKNYVTCALGIHYVGFVMICFGASNSLCSFAFGKLAQYTGRIALFCLAAVTNLGCFLGLLFWEPHPDLLGVFFVFPALWGMADAVWQTQTNALYGILFVEHKEAAFANYRMWESLGFVIAFAYSTFICLSTKIYVALAVLALTMVTYLYVEYNEYKHPTPQVTIDNLHKPEKTDLKELNDKDEKDIISQTQM
uniref:Protein unc-93 homolog A n=1 Tax=Sinocyclocheilus grahami TaxID=75366 RepID=A0A672QDJ4_SINGR